MSNGYTDIAVGMNVSIPTAGVLSKKPSYLVILEGDGGKTKKNNFFITFDKPEFLPGFIQVKGFFCDSKEEEIIKNFSELLTNISKDLILEVILPWHKICRIRSLVFKQK